MIRSVVFDNTGTSKFSKKRHGRPPATKLESVGVRANIDSIKCALSARLSLASAFQPSWIGRTGKNNKMTYGSMQKVLLSDEQRTIIIVSFSNFKLLLFLYRVHGT